MTTVRTSDAERLPRAVPLVPVDALRAAALASVVAATLAHGWLGFALFFLVLGGTFVPRALGTAAPLDLAYCGTLLLGAWAAQLDWYVAIGWLDVLVHAAATGLIAAVGYDVLVRVGALPGADDPRHSRPWLGAALVTTVLGVTLSVVWEFGEWFGHTVIDPAIQVGYTDTLGDLAAGSLGALLAGLFAARVVTGARR